MHQLPIMFVSRQYQKLLDFMTQQPQHVPSIDQQYPCIHRFKKRNHPCQGHICHYQVLPYRNVIKFYYPDSLYFLLFFFRFQCWSAIYILLLFLRVVVGIGMFFILIFREIVTISPSTFTNPPAYSGDAVHYKIYL